MRIALCLSGIVGKLYTNKGNYKWENDVDFRIGHYHYKKHIFDVNENVDVFIHSWDTKYENEIVNTYNPKKYKFQEQIIFDEDNVYFGSYRPNSKFTISGNISGSKYNYYLDNNPISFKGQGVGGKINSFFYDPSGIEFETNLKVKTNTFGTRVNFPETFFAAFKAFKPELICIVI